MLLVSPFVATKAIPAELASCSGLTDLVESIAVRFARFVGLGQALPGIACSKPPDAPGRPGIAAAAWQKERSSGEEVSLSTCVR